MSPRLTGNEEPAILLDMPIPTVIEIKTNITSPVIP